MLMRNLVRRIRTAQDVIVAKDARIRELEGQLHAANASVVRLLRGADSRQRTGDVSAQLDEMGKQLQRQARTIDRLRAGLPDTEETARLRRALVQEKAANRALENRVALLQAANSGIRTLERAS